MSIIRWGVTLLFWVLIASCGGKKAADAGGEKSDPLSKYTQEKGNPVASKENTENTENTMEQKGGGPIAVVKLGEIDASMAAEGKKLFKVNCTACHMMKKRLVGPPLIDVTKRRSPEWIMNMILNPEVMVKEDPIAKKLLAEYITQMENRNLSKEEARRILEYFRSESAN